ncbi:peptidoglycan DD-metalloendopeptidase family protein [Allochromatium palmeri]|uniref:Peptidoglycan DD-metalloendopeptidase family protein n=1 Tax=Allochromatium palmeri TaxID=231048 RepID=A0A6N8EK97_9GAMM|nr:peptidoglycan DD-metalloendopeptidase family protein [Allochromatium palmeri]
MTQQGVGLLLVVGLGLWAGWMLPRLLAPAVVSPALAQPISLELSLPVDCTPGKDCYVQNLVDTRPGSGVADYRCGTLTYDGHTGTDFRLANLQAMREGVAVLAAADGVVKALRDGEPDISVRQRGRESIRQREAGNAVILRHREGWETLYGHLRAGSVKVTKGQHVQRGDVLGLIGLSGLTEFPHVHFAVRHEGKVVDPFTGREPAAMACGEAVEGLWQAALRPALSYRPTAILTTGFALQRPEPARERDRPSLDGTVAVDDPPALIFWADVMGPRKGGQGRLQIIAPDGELLVDRPLRLEKDQAQRFVYAGRSRPPDGWKPGPYLGRVSLTASAVAEGDEQASTSTLVSEQRIEIR